MARDLYRECLDEDPDYAPAWARLGRCYRFLGKFGQEGPDSLELAKWAFPRVCTESRPAHRAQPLYPDGGRLGHAQEAMVRILGQAERHPHDPELFGGLVQAAATAASWTNPSVPHHHARRLDPRIVTSVAHTFFLLGDYQRTLEVVPAGRSLLSGSGGSGHIGREAEAADLLRRRSCPGGQFPAMVESLRFFLQGDHARSLEIVRQALAAQPAWDPEVKFYLARQLARDGAHADALRTMRDLVTEGFFCSTALRCDPWLRPLSQLPDFKGVLDLVLTREAEARAAFEAAGGHGVL